MSGKPDPLLAELNEAVTEVAKKFEADDTSSLLILAAKEAQAVGGVETNVKTFFGAVGDYELLGVALYNELAARAEDDDYELFFALRDALLTFAKDYSVAESESTAKGPLAPNEKILH